MMKMKQKQQERDARENREKEQTEQKRGKTKEGDILSYDRILEVFPANKAGKWQLFLTITTAYLILLHVCGDSDSCHL